MIHFYYKDRLLLSISIEGTFAGEIEATKKLLAYENRVSADDIVVVREKVIKNEIYQKESC